MVTKSSNTPKVDQVNPVKGLPEGMTQEQMQKLIAAFQQQKLQEMPVVKRKFMQFMQYITPKFQASVHNVDRFINFVVKPSDEDRNDVVQAARYPILFGTNVIILFFVFGGTWAALAPLDSASHAMGTVISSTQKKVLQHPVGGIIKTIYVKQGDHVKEGDPIVALDDTRFKSDYDASLSNYRSLKAAESRLLAEKDNKPNIDFSPDLLKDAERPEVVQIIDTQRHLFLSKKELMENMEKHHQQRLEQTSKHIEGLKEAKISAEKIYEFHEERLKGAKTLLAKGIIAKQALQQIEAQYSEAKASLSNKDIDIIKAEQEISRMNIEFMERKSQILTQTIDELKQTQMHLGEVRERYAAAKDSLDRAIITSPVEGIVNSLSVNTIGGVIGGGQAIAEVYPIKDYLIVEAKIAPQDIGYVTNGMMAKMRFNAFKSRTTPVFNGKVVSISPDLVVDKNPTGPTNAYYIARIELDMDEFNTEAKRLDLTLIPGMQVDVNVITGTRTLLKYLLDPVTDNMFKAFKEK